MTKKKPIVIGLTGSIGMGKSETAKMFKRAHIPVFDSDMAVHDLMARDGAATETIENAFPGVMGPDGIDRKRLGERVFGDQAALKKLESILHPMVSDLRHKFIKLQHATGIDMVVIDVPLLFETAGDADCDYTVVVTAPAAVQRQRVLARSGMTVQKFDHILTQQMPDSEKRQRADFYVQTDRGFDYAEQQVAQIIGKIRTEQCGK